MGRETGHLQLLASLLLTGGKGADLVIRGNVVLNTLSARSTSTLLRCIISSSNRQVSGLAEPSYATGFDSPLHSWAVCNFWIRSAIYFRSVVLSQCKRPELPVCPPRCWGTTDPPRKLAGRNVVVVHLPPLMIQDPSSVSKLLLGSPALGASPA
jgi:hypothetical protein